MSKKIKNRLIDCINIMLTIIIVITFPYVFPKEEKNSGFNDSNINENLSDEIPSIPSDKTKEEEKINNDTEVEFNKNENKTSQNNVVKEEKENNVNVEKNEESKQNNAANKVDVETKKIETDAISEDNFMSNKFLVSYNKMFVPDKYNTGIDRTKKLFIYDLDSTPNLNGINVVRSTTSSGGVVYPAAVISIYKNPNLSGEYIIENVDFTNYYFRIYSFIEHNKKVKIIFRNCKFDNINTAEDMGDNVYFVFENSEFSHFSGSNSTFLNCKFGNSKLDAINPFKNIIVKNSYIGNLAVFSNSSTHLDGIQIFARKNIVASNIHFYNTRIDAPYIKPCKDGVCSKASVNAPIMLQLEYNNGNDISFEKMYINGGGYSIYTRALNGFNYSNVLFKDISIGEGMLYKNFYPDITEEGLTINNVINSDKLLIGSIWKDSLGVHISTTNYTLIDRKLTCDTNKGVFEFNIKAHPKLSKENSTNYSFSDLPYDINNIIKSSEITNIKCYDTTINKELKKNNLLIDYTF